MEILIGTLVRYIGSDHPFLSGSLVRVKAVHRGHFADPDKADIIKTGLVEAGEQDMVEVAPLKKDGSTSWVTSDARISDLEAD